MARLILKIIAIIIIVCISSLFGLEVQAQPYIMLHGGPKRCGYETQGVDCYEVFEVWVWVIPSDNGVRAVEYSLSINQDIVLAIDETPNPAVTVYVGNPLDGVLIAFSQCQREPFWAFKYLFCPIFCSGELPSFYMRVEPYYCSDALYVATCIEPDWPAEEADGGSYAINAPCCGCAGSPDVRYVKQIEDDRIRVVYNHFVSPALDSTIDNYLVYEQGSYENPIHITNADFDYSACQYCNYCDSAVVVLTLESALQDTVQYYLSIYGLGVECNDLCGRVYVDIEKKAVATLLQGYEARYANSAIEITWCLSEVDEEVEFIIYRFDHGDNFIKLPLQKIIKMGELKFKYIDDTIERGSYYRYRVNYEIGDKEAVLFETETIQTPSLPLTLYQNHPNPFNPRTAIKYYLPAETRVRLSIYDISGRHIASIVNDFKQKGEHTVEWNGLDSNGKKVGSGIYIYQLNAGKESISRKMVILR